MKKILFGIFVLFSASFFVFSGCNKSNSDEILVGEFGSMSG